MVELPSGTVTFLFTDLEISTRLWDQEPDAMGEALARHDVILRETIAKHGGQVVKGRGDGVHAVFTTADAALRAAIDGQVQLDSERWMVSEPLRVRMGLHTGTAEVRDGDYFGSAVNRAARVMDLAHGGQVVCSQSTADLARDALPEGLDLVDLGEQRLRDLSRPERVFQVQSPGLRSDFPVLASLDAFPGNLPLQVSSFVGREREIERIKHAFDTMPVVTLTGVGGVGKTRLALQVAARVVPDFPDGAWLVELAAVRDPDGVPAAFASVFNVIARAGQSAEESLIEFFRAKQLLLVVDNCDHLLAPVARLLEAIERSCAGVVVIATSREGLGLEGEQNLTVPSLAAPAPTADVEATSRSEAVTLFVQRAQRADANFALTTDNAGAIAQVCRRVDGIALAIELAAARVAMLTPAELARRLDQLFRVLAGGHRSAVERHQTLQAMIDWSYDLLNDAEQLLLARLSIFVGGFTLEAAEAIAAGVGVDADAVFEALAALVARHLVVADTEDVESRYHLLETIRQYGQERLDERGEMEGLRAKHAAYFLEFGETAIPDMSGPDGVEWERRLAQEFDNIRAALTWAIDIQDVDTAVRLLAMWDAPPIVTVFVPVSTVFWAADAVVDLPGASEHPRYAAALVVAAFSARNRGDHTIALQRSAEALAAEERSGTYSSIGLPVVRSWIALTEGAVEVMMRHSREAVAMARARDDTAWLIQALGLSAIANSMSGDTARALSDAEAVITLLLNLPRTHVVLSAVAYAAFALRDAEPERAMALVREIVPFDAAVGAFQAGWVNPHALMIGGNIAAHRGDRREALRYFDAAIEKSDWLGHRQEVRTTISLAAVLLADEDPEASAVLFGAGDAPAPDYAHTPRTVEARERAVAMLEKTLGKSQYAELYARGQAMNDFDAGRYVRAAISRVLAAPQ